MGPQKTRVNKIVFPPVAQLDNAADSDSEDRGFESLRAGHHRTPVPVNGLCGFFYMIIVKGRFPMIRTIGIVSLSSGILGEDFVSYELKIGVQRLESMGLRVKFLPHALKGIDYVKAHPERRAADLLEAFRDPEIDMVLCAIGGDDTYRLLPYLFDNNELQSAVCDKVFLGFSDTTVNHFMLLKAGLRTFYGQSFLADICEPGEEMPPYSRRYFEELIFTGRIREIKPSDVWYEERESFGPEQAGVPLVSHPDRGFLLLQGSPVFSGRIFGGCIDTIHDFFNGERYADMPALCEKYGLFPPAEAWKDHILLLESSEEKMSPEKYRRALTYLKEAGVFSAVSGVLVGKPMDETYEAEYLRELQRVIGDPALPVVCNLNIGHAQPRCIIPFETEAEVDAVNGWIRFGN